jgi:hypothetical protein
MNKHTPGPWRYDYAPGFCGELLAANGTTLAEFVSEPSEANARLIAAAPELLEALQGLLRGIANGPDEANAAMLVAKARDAVNKATGEK